MDLYSCIFLRSVMDMLSYSLLILSMDILLPTEGNPQDTSIPLSFYSSFLSLGLP